VGSYAVLRLFIQTPDDVRRMFKMLCLVLLPVGALMLVEQWTGENAFGPLGGVSSIAQARENGLRASGPFAHPLLSGTVGATLVPMTAALWRRSRMLALIGLAAGLAMLVASASSGPFLMLGVSALLLMMWRLRAYTLWMAWSTLAALVTLHVVMNDPVYFLMARIDVVGGSTGWHRAQLIQAALQQLGEWWFAGTDYTRHWMPTGIPATDQHTDITNHYLSLGVHGGLPLMALFVFIIVASLRYGVKAALRSDDAAAADAFLAWTTTAILLSHAVNFLACSLFDQSIVSFVIVVAAAGVFRAAVTTEQPDHTPGHEPVPQRWAHPIGGTH
jgi:hypothetical protein